MSCGHKFIFPHTRSRKWNLESASALYKLVTKSIKHSKTLIVFEILSVIFISIIHMRKIRIETELKYTNIAEDFTVIFEKKYAIGVVKIIYFLNLNSFV